VRAELAHELHERCGRPFEGLEREAAEGQVRERIALGQAGVGEAQPPLLHAELGDGARHLDAPQARQVAAGMRVALHRRVEDVTALAARARGHHDLGTRCDVGGHGGRTLARLVVGVGVDREEAEARSGRAGKILAWQDELLALRARTSARGTAGGR
jgi:hypothetical protein